MERRYAALALLVFMLVAGRATAAAGAAPHQQQQDPVPAVVKDFASQVWKVMSPLIEKGMQAGREVAQIVYEKASFQGLKSVAAEASRISWNFFTGKPYQAAYQVAKDVPGVGHAVKDVVGEANLRKQAAREKAQENRGL